MNTTVETQTQTHHKIMDQTAKVEKECGIRLDVLKNPVALPCSHRICSGAQSMAVKSPVPREDSPFQRYGNKECQFFSESYMIAKSKR